MFDPRTSLPTLMETWSEDIDRQIQMHYARIVSYRVKNQLLHTPIHIYIIIAKNQESNSEFPSGCLFVITTKP